MKEYLEATHGERPEGFEERIIYSETRRVWCMGEHMDHPKVYYTIPDDGEVVCGYCDTIFRLKKKEDDDKT